MTFHIVLQWSMRFSVYCSLGDLFCYDIVNFYCGCMRSEIFLRELTRCFSRSVDLYKLLFYFSIFFHFFTTRN